jgi:chromatin structure-remodeling complex subunit SFH1
MRTGVTGLVQPEVTTGGPREREYLLAELDKELASVTGKDSGTSTPRFESPGVGPSLTGRRSAAVSTLSGRRSRGGVVSYAETGSDEEESEEELDDGAISDPEDGGYGERKKSARDKDRRGTGPASMTATGPAGYADPQVAVKVGRVNKKREEMEKGLTWLGDRAPGERIKSVRVRPTKHVYV